jgi:hypothetical protein
VLSGHEVPGAEVVVERRGDVAIVERRDDPADAVA